MRADGLARKGVVCGYVIQRKERMVTITESSRGYLSGLQREIRDAPDKLLERRWYFGGGVPFPLGGGGFSSWELRESPL
jgi:hypothetical protein